MKKKLISLMLAASSAVYAIPSLAVELDERYDEVKYYNPCETETEGLELKTDAPDGSGFYTNGGSVYRGLTGLESDTSEDYMWELDVLFDKVGHGFTVRDKKNKKYNSCVTRQDKGGKAYITVQTGGSSYSYYTEIEDTSTWYRIQLSGQYGTTKPMTMTVYKWNGGTLELEGEYEGVSKRNNAAAGYIQIEAGTSFDNARIVKLGADELVVSTMPENITELNAGSDVNMTFTALRDGKSVTSPEVEWKIYENNNELTDGSVSVSSDGELSTARDCGDKEITVKAISTEKGNAEGEYRIKINSVDFSAEQYDTLSLSAEKDYVKAGEWLALSAEAFKDGATVELGENDVVWTFYDGSNVQKLGNRYITVRDDRLYVDERVISQNITVRAENESGTVSASLPIRIKASDADEADESGTGDKLLVSNAYEYAASDEGQKTGSWDGSHYYEYSAVTDLDGIMATNEDIIIEYDVKFTEENSGTKLRNSGNSKEGGQIARQGGKIGRIGSGNKFLAFANGDAQSWYHVVIKIRCGAESTYANAFIYKYNEDGERVHPDSGELNKAATGALDLRTVGAQRFHHVQAQSGTGIDNLRIIRIVPDEMKITMPAENVFAGRSLQAAFYAYHGGEEMPSFSESRVEWAIYDSENLYPAPEEITDLIKIDSSGLISIDAMAAEQTVYIRVTSTESGAYASLPLRIKGSDIFTVKGIGLSEDRTRITELKVEKNFYYSGDVVFVIALYDESGVLAGVKQRSMRDNTLAIGENKISIDFELPQSFASSKIMVWTAM